MQRAQRLRLDRRDGRDGDLAAAGAVLAYSAVLNRVLPPRVHLPANLVAAGTAVLAARVDGASWDDLGLEPSRLGAGARAGLVVAVPLLATTAAAALLPSTQKHFDDPRIVAARHPFVEVALRIPVGTALCEELIFRGALLARYGRHGSFVRAAASSSMVFGLWHVLPTLDAVAENPPDPERPLLSAAIVVRAVAVTTAAGVAFAVLRRRSGSVLAPVVVHTAMNASGFVAARVLAARHARMNTIAS